MSTPSRFASVAQHALSALIAFAFLAAGTFKLSGAPEMVENFSNYGLPLWFMYLTGATEIASAILLLIPKTRALGATILSSIMVGAFGTHVMIGDIPGGIPALVLLGLSASIAFWRKEDLLRYLPSSLKSAKSA